MDAESKKQIIYQGKIEFKINGKNIIYDGIINKKPSFGK